MGELDLEIQWLSSWACQKKKIHTNTKCNREAVHSPGVILLAFFSIEQISLGLLCSDFMSAKNKKAIKRTMRKKLEYFKCG